MSSFLLLWLQIISIHTVLSKILSSGSTEDDWSVIDAGSGWINGGITTISSTTDKQYHGLFDGDVGQNNLTRNDIKLEKSGTLTMNFTLIFGCLIIEITDKITVTMGTTSADYYWVDTLGEYPYTAPSGFIINELNIEPVLYESCTSSVAYNDTVFSISSSITSQEYDANTAINIAFVSSFNYSIPFDEDDKYWAVTDIIFTVEQVIDAPVITSDDTATLVAIIIICVIVFLLFIVLFKYCYKGKKISNRKKKRSLNNIHTGTEELLQQSTNKKPTTELVKGKNKKKGKSKTKKKSDLEEKEALLENEKLKEKLVEIGNEMEEISNKQMDKDNDIKQREVKIESMKLEMNDLQINIDSVKKQNASKELELMRKDEEIRRQMEELKKLEKKENMKHISMGNGNKLDIEWMKMKTCLLKGNDMDLVKIDHGEFVAVSLDKNDGRIYKYDADNRWVLWMKYDAKDLKSKYWTVSGDEYKGKIFMFGNEGEMVEIDVRRKKVDIIKKLNKCKRDAMSVVIDGRMHILGGRDSWHLLWNSKVKILKNINSTNDDVGRLKEIKCFGLVYLKKKGVLLLMGGKYESVNDEIWQYSFNSNSWLKLNNLLPFKMHSFGCIVTNNQQYVVIFGGIRSNGQYMTDIFILDIDTMIMRRSNIKCPITGKVKVLLIDDTEQFKILLYGLIRETTDKFISHDIFNIIIMYSVSKNIHLFNQNNGKHWTMNIDNIIQ